MHGRPVGKRVTADFFRRTSAEHGIEACEYLLAVDIDMNPLPGYRFANWDTGLRRRGVPPRLRHGAAHPVAAPARRW